MCLVQEISPRACYIRFQDSEVYRSEHIGQTSRGEILVADYNDRGDIIGIELLGDKPCHHAETHVKNAHEPYGER